MEYYHDSERHEVSEIQFNPILLFKNLLKFTVDEKMSQSHTGDVWDCWAI